MNSLREIVESSPRLRGLATNVRHNMRDEGPQSLGPARWDWEAVNKVLLIRLRSIGDTVLATPSILALRRFLPNAQIDILLEDWVGPVLQDHDSVSRIVAMERGSLASRARVAREIRSAKYDVVYNLHGGTTATLLARASGATHRVGYATYQYPRLYNHLAPSPLLLWGQQKTHSVEQQLGLLGWTGVPVSDRPPTNLAVTSAATEAVTKLLALAGVESGQFALVHPAAAFSTKQWAAEKFARVVDHLASRGITTVAIATERETALLAELTSQTSARVVSLHPSLPEVAALAAQACLFVGNDSGIAHIAAAIGTPSVVVFGSSNIAHWRPWSTAAAEVVFEEMPCQPCHGYFCEQFAQPECILRVPVERVNAAVDRVLGLNS